MIVDYISSDLDSFWQNYSISEASIQKYIVNDTLIYLSIPHRDYDSHDMALTCISDNKEAWCRALELEIEGIGSLLEENRDYGKLLIDEEIKERSLFRTDLILVEEIKNQELADSSKNTNEVRVTLKVQVANRDRIAERSVKYVFHRKVRRYLPMR